jgi:hypothetical protein
MAGIEKVFIGEMIGRASTNLYGSRLNLGVSVDTTIPDYTFWSKLRRGKATGYELGGLFAQPIGRITTSWTLGRGFAFTTGEETTEAELGRFVATNMTDFMEWFYDSLSLGDAYLVVNPDGTLTPVPANQMEVITNPLDFRQITGYKITTVLPGGVTIEDEYGLKERIVRVKRGTDVQTIRYANLIGRLPVIALHNDREANEVYGHPVYESLLTLFAEYDDVIRKALDGVKVMGNPLIAIEGAENPDEELDRLASEDDSTYRNATSNVQQDRKTVDLNITPGDVLVLGKGATINFKGPNGGFTNDAGKMLEFLFLLMLQHSKIPEWAWGGAISSSKASVDSQLPAFALFIQSVQSKLEKALIQLAEIYLATRGLVVPLPEVESVAIKWNPLTDKNEEIVQAWVELLHGKGLITDTTAVAASGLVEDAQAEVDDAKAELAKDQDDFEKRVEKELEAA